MIVALESGVTNGGAGWRNAWCYVDSDTAKEALDFVQDFYKRVRGDREAIIRVKPCIETQRDFEKDKIITRAVVRFAFADYAGPERKSEAASDGMRRYLPLPPLRKPG
jgi:hypothetical protein